VRPYYQLYFNNYVVSLRDVITERVYQAVDNHNWFSLHLADESIQLPLVQIAKVDAEQEILRACEAFEKDYYFAFCSGIRLDSLDDLVAVDGSTSVICFIPNIKIKGR